MSLLIAWAYFHKWYEDESDLSSNFLLIAPNIIVLDRLRADFDGLRIFHEDPVLPENGYEGQNWQDDFQVTLHVQDEIGIVSETGNIFLTNFTVCSSTDRRRASRTRIRPTIFWGGGRRGRRTNRRSISG